MPLVCLRFMYYSAEINYHAGRKVPTHSTETLYLPTLYNTIENINR